MIIFDLGGVLLKEAELNLNKAITYHWEIDNTKDIPRIFNKTFEFANKIFNKDCKKKWIIGSITGSEIIKTIKENIDKEEFNSFFKNKEEKNLIKFGSEIILDPTILTNFTELYAEGLDFVKKCKMNGFKVAILSNWDPHSFKLIKTKFGDLFNLFEDKNIFIPADIGHIKPDIESYEFILKTNNLSPNSTFFVDDSLTNIEGAKQLGIKSVVHNGNWKDTERKLQEYGLKL